MREHILVRAARALVAVAILSQFAQNHVCRAAFLSVYGGPANSGTSNYLANPPFDFGVQSIGAAFYPQQTLVQFPAFYGAVNNSGVAVGNVLQVSPGSSDANATVAKWSASSAPVFLDQPSPGAAIVARAINDAGVVVGHTDPSAVIQATSTSLSIYTSGPTNAVQWNSSGAITLLSGLGSTSADGTASMGFNNQEMAIVATNTTFFGSRAGRWDTSSNIATEITTSGSDVGIGAVPYAINNQGTAVGQSGSIFNGPIQAIRWDAGQSVGTLLPDLGHAAGVQSKSAALSINNAGTAVGFATLYSSGTSQGIRAVMWDSNGAITQLGDSNTSTLFTKSIYALAINNAGVIIGNDATFPNQHALVWNPGSTSPIELTALGTLFGSPNDTQASAINSQGIIVGYSVTTVPFLSTFTSGPHHAVYWNADGSVVDLNSLIDPASGWTLTNATAISDTGWVLGLGTFDPDGAGGQSAYERLFLVQVPEPSSIILIAFGALLTLIFFVASKFPNFPRENICKSPKGVIR